MSGLAVLAALCLGTALPGAGAVRVRILERAHPSRLALGAGPGSHLSCDGVAIAETRFELALDQGKIALGDRHCRQVELEAGSVPTRVIVRAPARNALDRRYAGALRIVALAHALEVVNTVSLEGYVASVVASESDGSARAALEAQAITSRSYAVAQLGRHGKGYDFCDLAHCQVYRGDPGEGGARAAAEATRGKVLTEQDHVVTGYFHSACAGHTAPARVVMGEKPDPALAGVDDRDPQGRPWCAASPHLSWTTHAKREALRRALGQRGTDRDIRIVQRDPSGVVTEVLAFGRRYSGEVFKSRVGRALGWRILPSSNFELTANGAQVTFHGHGMGHGVGLCQAGAEGMARAGKTTTEILAHYFPGAQITGLGY